MKHLLLTFVLITLSCYARGALDAKEAFAIDFKIVEQVFASGTVPQFEMSVRNISHQSLQVLDLNKRLDWQHAEARVSIWQKGKEMTTSTSGVIEDPGPITPEDYLTIRSKNIVSFHLRDFIDSWRELAPGEYTARVDYLGGCDGVTGTVRSNEVSFRVTK